MAGRVVVVGAFRFPALEPALRDILQGEPGE